MSCIIKFHWDSEAAVWIATSDDVPGLVLESGSFDEEHRGRFSVFEENYYEQRTGATIV